ncbi:MAG: HAMP domain-containing sensor histidine kinase [Armatimonadota bacterium]|nr:HAMP domain-containing sensor histidine kinase [Armatimonadota bacterium]MDR7438713.1 HAMP domain-containing sensor histidine kinase [Armatimonadota bacterium]MDR7561929.1 HAMP domain-containing sensor histidine kinase [Armatimonadota bacterium]MDR7601840.1 HAMP domain-containing sensor histidine kinase [Armatimonadota bacterium]
MVDDGRARGRGWTLRAQLSLAFVLVAVASVALVGLWAQYILDRQFTRFLERVRRGEVTWITEQPPHIRELFYSTVQPSWTRRLFHASRRKFLRAFNASLWLGGTTAAAVAVLAGVWLAHRLTRPLLDLRQAVGRVAAGDLRQHVRPGPGEIGELAQAFNAMATRLEANERLRREFLAAVAHELRTPLSIVQANLESFLDGVAEPTPERIAALHTQCALLSRLISDLRDLSLAEAGQLHLQRTPTDLGALCASCVEGLQPWAEERGVRVELEALPGLVAEVDPDRMRQVVQNLLHNAVRFTPPGGVVRFRVSRAARGVRIELEDEGPGIPPEDLPYVFEPFYRADRSRSRETGGSGLGLAVVRRLVESHGGEVRAENRVPRGARFVVELPS